MKKFIPVDEYTSPIEWSFEAHTPINIIEEFFNVAGYRHAPILENGKPVGIVTQRDLFKAKANCAAREILAKDIMIEDPFCVLKGADLEDVVFEMSNRKIGSALVINSDGILDGIFTSIDGLNALIEVIREQPESTCKGEKLC